MLKLWASDREAFRVELEKIARGAVSDVVTAFANKERCSGGWFRYLVTTPGSMWISTPVQIGTLGADETIICRRFAAEKADRLGKNPEHWLSWQSRDPESGKWGGAIRIICGTIAFIFSISGLPELCDEAAMLITGVRAGLLSVAQAREIAVISNNRFFLENNWGFRH